ncbi:tRNA 2-thiouridine synthesizing protein A [Cellulomonas sp. SLBN-39]|nr:tRNA 2-thiouridine synthesizing protein A [Cellulomonas sp. SLBN-39]
MTPGGADDDPPVVVDARGLRCPLPVVRAAAAARDRPGGTVLTVLATDPAAALDLPAWARMRGHALLDVREPGPGGGAWEVDVRLAAPASP